MVPAKADSTADPASNRQPAGIRPEDRAIAVAILGQPERFSEYALCARLGIPSVAAIALEVADRLPHLRRNRAFKIWLGSEVAKVMRAHGYVLVQARGRVPWGNYFTYGAVWGLGDSDSSEAESSQSVD
jgi:hypothetical protein